MSRFDREVLRKGQEMRGEKIPRVLDQFQMRDRPCKPGDGVVRDQPQRNTADTFCQRVDAFGEDAESEDLV